MFVIFGTRGVTSTQDHGQFYCPQCAAHTEYKKKSVRRFFTLFFIPVIPLNEVGAYIECQTCEGTFRFEVLDYDPAAQQRRVEAEFHGAVKLVMIHMLLADGDVDTAEVSAMATVMEDITGARPDRELLEEQVRSSAITQRDPIRVAAEVVPTLNVGGRELVMRAAIMVALADGVLAPEEEELLRRLGNALELSKAHVRGLMMEGGAAD